MRTHMKIFSFFHVILRRSSLKIYLRSYEDSLKDFEKIFKDFIRTSSKKEIVWRLFGGNECRSYLDF